MKAIAFSIIMAVLCCTATLGTAQTTPTPTRYVAHGYHKVAPDKQDDFLKLTKVWKKIIAGKKKAGLQDDWSLAKIALAGASSEYNYVTRQVFIGETQLANFLEKPFLPEDWRTFVTPEEAALVDRAHEIRTLVKWDVWSTTDGVSSADMSGSTVIVFNFYQQPEGKTRADHIQIEQNVWKPVHAARIKDGAMKGWVLLSFEHPREGGASFSMATVSLYADAEQMLKSWMDVYFKKVHPGKDADQAVKQTNEAARLVRSETRVVIDRLNW